MADSQGNQRCFLHNPSDSAGNTGKFISFTANTLSKCTKILKTRKVHKLKYDDVVLPSEEKLPAIGYHRECYSKFTAVPKKKLAVESEPCSSSKEDRVTRSFCPDKLTSPDNRVFKKLCIFCDQESKKVKGVMQNLSKCEVKKDLKDEISDAIRANSCCIHVAEGACEGEMFKFTKELLCRAKLSHYVRIKMGLRLSEFTLPNNLDTNVGFHVNCLRTYFNVNDVVSKSSFENNVKMYAIVLDDSQMLDRISCIDFLAKEVYYHSHCRSAYQSRPTRND